jgi:outer membrane protein assembly factor BamB
LRCAPLVTPSSRIILRFHEGIYSLDPETGKLLWMHDLTWDYLCATVTPDSGTVFANERRKALTKFNDKGQILWTVRLPLDGVAISSPQALWPSGDVVVRTRTHVVSISPTGVVNWMHAHTDP